LANHKSALKRSRQNETRHLRNRSVKTRVRNIVKDIKIVAGKNDNKDTSLKTLDMAKSIIAKAAKNGVIHKKNASRKISRLSKLINKAK
jgi:small subunit ribosomal protein S20